MALAGTLSLGGCGFQPVYMPTASGKAGPAERNFEAISVNLIPDRPGQLLRQELQRQFGSDSDAVAARYDLAVAYSIAGEGIAVISTDTSPSRIRFIARATWTLRSRASPPAVVTTGSARAFDAQNIFDQQYFAADLETEAVQRRLAAAIAEEIAQQLAVYFRRQAAG